MNIASSDPCKGNSQSSYLPHVVIIIIVKLYPFFLNLFSFFLHHPYRTFMYDMLSSYRSPLCAVRVYLVAISIPLGLLPT